MKSKNTLSLVLIALSLFFFFLPATYYGFVDYIIDNTVINMNLERDTIETDKASIAIFNGAKLDFISTWWLSLLTILGFVTLYLGVVIKLVGFSFLRKDYWITFRIKP
jgi:hypothetical protein